MQDKQMECGPSSERRRRITTTWCIAAAAALMVCFGATELRHVLPTMDEDGLAQSLRQSAWNKALSDQSDAASWPWQNLSQRMSPLPSATVRRLGLSASLRDMTDVAEAPGAIQPAEASLAHATPRSQSMTGDIALGDTGSGTVAIGDSITFTANDGATCVYRVTGRPVVDPHLDPGQAEGAQREAGLFECSPFDTLIMRATQQDSAPQARPADHQRKL